MGWWVLTFLENDRSLHHLRVLAGTSAPTHLMMAWSRHKPMRQRIYRTVRGKRVFCGWKYIWDTPNLTEQWEEGTTRNHYFGPISLASTDHVWYVLASPGIAAGTFCQGPLIHVSPPELYTWTKKVYAGTRLKGIYYTNTFTGPGGEHPIWQSRNQGLHSWDIWQLEPDPLGLAYRIYAIAGVSTNRILYERLQFALPLWIPLLTDAACIAIIGSVGGTMTWVATNIYFPGHIYVLFNTPVGDSGVWCIRSLDYGETWNAFQIYAGFFNTSAGNISVGLVQGTSPYDPGTVLCASLCEAFGGRGAIYTSTDVGETWSLQGWAGFALQTPRCLVDPTDQSIVYIGIFTGAPGPAELFRSENHGAALVEVDGLNHLGPQIAPKVDTACINPTDPLNVKVLSEDHIWTTSDYCVNWTNHGPLERFAVHLGILWENPLRCYLANNTSAPPPPHPWGPHVLYTSEDYGATMYGKCGAYAAQDDGHGDSIPWNCGGICHQGMQLFPPY